MKPPPSKLDCKTIQVPSIINEMGHCKRGPALQTGAGTANGDIRGTANGALQTVQTGTVQTGTLQTSATTVQTGTFNVCKRQTANGKRQTANGNGANGDIQGKRERLQTANGKRQTANGKRQTSEGRVNGRWQRATGTFKASVCKRERLQTGTFKNQESFLADLGSVCKRGHSKIKNHFWPIWHFKWY